MESTRKSYLKLSLALLILIIFWLLTSRSFNDMAFLWMMSLMIISTLVITKNIGKLSKRDYLVGFLLSGLVFLSNPFLAVVTLLTYLASCLWLKGKEASQDLLWPRSSRKFFHDTIYGLVPGFFLGILNLLLAKGTMAGARISLPNSISLQPIFNAIRAGVFEETAFTLFFFAFSVALVKKEKFSKLENILVYLIMVLPHTLVHFSRQDFELGNVLVLSLLFGFPFALLLRKRGLVSAIIAHTMVDLIRFLFSNF